GLGGGGRGGHAAGGHDDGRPAADARGVLHHLPHHDVAAVLEDGEHEREAHQGNHGGLDDGRSASAALAAGLEHHGVAPGWSRRASDRRVGGGGGRAFPPPPPPPPRGGFGRGGGREGEPPTTAGRGSGTSVFS